MTLLRAVKASPKPFLKHEELVAHYPMRGPAEQVDVMFIGRALNGWNNRFSAQDIIDDPEKVFEQIRGNGMEGKFAEQEQLRWVVKADKTQAYNSNQSQFWQTIRGVMEARVADPEKWWHGIVWTNFLKLSRNGKNPTGKMVHVIGKPSMDLLLAEVAEYRPKNIVCLSGMDYAANFLARCTTTARLSVTDGTGYLEYTGDATLNDHSFRLVIAPHPQTRVTNDLISEILETLS